MTEGPVEQLALNAIVVSSSDSLQCLRITSGLCSISGHPSPILSIAHVASRLNIAEQEGIDRRGHFSRRNMIELPLIFA